MSKEIEFIKEPAERLADSSLVQNVRYTLNNKDWEVYVCSGEDCLELDADWAFKYLDLLEQIKLVSL